jgi:steroid 5-alpha reductase family enzyme
LKKERFEDTQTDTGLIVFIVILILVTIIVQILLLIAVYKITNESLIDTLLCLAFGSVYVVFAIIYYGFSGYKFCMNNKK